jgi:hypothetical protein
MTTLEFAFLLCAVIAGGLAFNALRGPAIERMEAPEEWTPSAWQEEIRKARLNARRVLKISTLVVVLSIGSLLLVHFVFA